MPGAQSSPWWNPKPGMGPVTPAPAGGWSAPENRLTRASSKVASGIPTCAGMAELDSRLRRNDGTSPFTADGYAVYRWWNCW